MQNKSRIDIGIRSLTHGETSGHRTHLYRVWEAMKRRCNNPKDWDYPRYGGRGISYKPEWKDFEVFKEDMYESYSKHYTKHGPHNTTIERINLDGNYSPENCKWATQKEQARNRRTTRYEIVNGIKKPLAEWAEFYGVSYKHLHALISYKGMNLEQAVSYMKR